MPIGDVVDWQGTKYVQTGEDSKNKDHWKPVSQVSSVPSKPFAPGQTNFLPSFGDVASATTKASKLINPGAMVTDKAFELLDRAAYEGGARVNDAASILGASPEVAAGAGVLGNMAIQAGPSILGGGIFKAASTPAAQSAARWAMQKAVKPDKVARESGAGAEAIETMLQEGINVTNGGMAELSKKVGALSGQVDDLINAADKAGTTVSKVSIVGAAREEIKRLGQALGSQDDVAAAEKVLERILTDPKIKDATEISVRAAQDIKKATYRALGEKAYNAADKLGTAEMNVTKGAIRGVKEGIERAVPGVKNPNQQMSKYLNAMEVVEPGVLAGGNANLGGLAYLAQNPLAAGGFMLDRSRLATSILGNGLYRSPSILGAGGMTGMGMYMQDYR